MYITTNTVRPVGQVANKPDCLIVCGQQLYVYLNLLAAVLGIFCLSLYFVKKRFLLLSRFKKKKLLFQILSGLAWIFLIFFLIYFIKIEYHPANGQCSVDGVLLQSSLFPDFFHPWYQGR